MTTADSLKDVLKRFEETFESIKKTTKPFATAQLNETTLKGLKKGIAMYIDLCGTTVKDLDASIKAFPDLSQMKSENMALGSKVQSLAFAAQEAEANLAKLRVEFDEEARALKEENQKLAEKLRVMEEENLKVVSLQDALAQETSEKLMCRTALQRLSEENTTERMDWQRTLASAQAVRWEDRHVLTSQRLSEESLRTHIDDLMEENRALRAKISITEKAVTRPVSAHTGASDVALSVLRESLASAKRDYDTVLAENRKLTRKNEELSTALASGSIRVLSPTIPPVVIPQSPPRLIEPPQIRHASSQTSGVSFEVLESEVSRLHNELIVSSERTALLEAELNSLRAQLLSSEEDQMREEIATLRSELKKKSLRISRLISELDGCKLNSKVGLEQAFEESQRGRASAELEVMALKKHLAYLQIQKNTMNATTQNEIGATGGPGVADPLSFIHTEADSLDEAFASSKNESIAQEAHLRSEIEHAEASVEYWGMQPGDSLSRRMLDDARRRLSDAQEALDKQLRYRKNTFQTWHQDRLNVIGKESACLRAPLN